MIDPSHSPEVMLAAAQPARGCSIAPRTAPSLPGRRQLPRSGHSVQPCPARRHRVTGALVRVIAAPNALRRTVPGRLFAALQRHQLTRGQLTSVREASVSDRCRQRSSQAMTRRPGYSFPADARHDVVCAATPSAGGLHTFPAKCTRAPDPLRKAPIPASRRHPGPMPPGGGPTQPACGSIVPAKKGQAAPSVRRRVAFARLWRGQSAPCRPHLLVRQVGRARAPLCLECSPPTSRYGCRSRRRAATPTARGQASPRSRRGLASSRPARRLPFSPGARSASPLMPRVRPPLTTGGQASPAPAAVWQAPSGPRVHRPCSPHLRIWPGPLKPNRGRASSLPQRGWLSPRRGRSHPIRQERACRHIPPALHSSRPGKATPPSRGRASPSIV